MNASRSSSSTIAPPASDISVRQTTSGSRVTMRGGAVGAQLGRTAPLHQRCAHRGQRQRQARGAREQNEDRQRRAVELMVGEDVGGLVREHGATLVGVEQADELGLHDHDRAPRADRHRVGRGVLREVQIGHLGHVERGVGDRMLAPDIAELLFGEPHRGAEVALAQRALVAELDQLAHDRVEIGDRSERGGGRPVGGMLKGARRDPGQPVALGGQIDSRPEEATPMHAPQRVLVHETGTPHVGGDLGARGEARASRSRGRGRS